MVLEIAFRSEERFTQDEFRRWVVERPPSDVHRYELLRGRIVMTPPAGWRHGGVEARLAASVGTFVQSRDLGVVFGSSTGYELPSGDTLEPDLSFVSSERWRALPRPIPEGFLRIAPTLVVEILSRSSASRDRHEKRAIYAQSGVEEYWLVDTARRQISVLVREGTDFDRGRVVSTGRIPSRVLPDLDARVQEIFALA